jgi:peptidyl-tRNA hydrolase, PTH1 family
VFFRWRARRPVKVIVGLGNPGPAYAATRHNVGARAVARFAEEAGVDLKPNRSFRSLIATVGRASDDIILVLPQTYMNLSGDAVKAVLRKKGAKTSDLLIVLDDADLTLGTLRVRSEGSAAGHNGLKSVIERLGTRDLPRLRMGIGPRDQDRDLADFVLEKFDKGEVLQAADMVARAAAAIKTWCDEGLSRAMNLYNPKS